MSAITQITFFKECKRLAQEAFDYDAKHADGYVLEKCLMHDWARYPSPAMELVNAIDIQCAEAWLNETHGKGNAYTGCADYAEVCQAIAFAALVCETRSELEYLDGTLS